MRKLQDKDVDRSEAQNRLKLIAHGERVANSINGHLLGKRNFGILAFRNGRTFMITAEFPRNATREKALSVYILAPSHCFIPHRENAECCGGRFAKAITARNRAKSFP
jgi:hypothetical protein